MNHAHSAGTWTPQGCLAVKRKEKKEEKTTPFGDNLIRIRSHYTRPTLGSELDLGQVLLTCSHGVAWWCGWSMNALRVDWVEGWPATRV